MAHWLYQDNRWGLFQKACTMEHCGHHPKNLMEEEFFYLGRKANLPMCRKNRFQKGSFSQVITHDVRY